MCNNWIAPKFFFQATQATSKWLKFTTAFSTKLTLHSSIGICSPQTKNLASIKPIKLNPKFQKTLLLLVLFFLALTTASAQKKITKKQFLADSAYIMRPKLARQQVRLDNRITFLKGQILGLNGFDAGVLLKDKLRFTFGYYKVSEKLTSLQKSFNGLDYTANYKLNYAAINLEFIYKNIRFISLGLPIEFGFGKNSINYTSQTNNL